MADEPPMTGERGRAITPMAELCAKLAEAVHHAHEQGVQFGSANHKTERSATDAEPRESWLCPV